MWERWGRAAASPQASSTFPGGPGEGDGMHVSLSQCSLASLEQKVNQLDIGDSDRISRRFGRDRTWPLEIWIAGMWVLPQE